MKVLIWLYFYCYIVFCNALVLTDNVSWMTDNSSYVTGIIIYFSIVLSTIYIIKQKTFFSMLKFVKSNLIFIFFLIAKKHCYIFDMWLPLLMLFFLMTRRIIVEKWEWFESYYCLSLTYPERMTQISNLQSFGLYST